MNAKLTPEDIHRLLKTGTDEEIQGANHALKKQLAIWALWFVGAKFVLYLGIAAAAQWARDNNKN